MRRWRDAVRHWRFRPCRAPARYPRNQDVRTSGFPARYASPAWSRYMRIRSDARSHNPRYVRRPHCLPARPVRLLRRMLAAHPPQSKPLPCFFPPERFRNHCSESITRLDNSFHPQRRRDICAFPHGPSYNLKRRWHVGKYETGGAVARIELCHRSVGRFCRIWKCGFVKKHG